MRAWHQWSQPARITTIVIAIAIIASVPLVYFLPGVHEVRKSFHEFSDQLVIGNFERAYQMTGPDFQAAISEQDFAAQQQLLSARYGDLRSVSVWSTTVEWNDEGTSATLSAHFKYEHSTRYFAVLMKQYEGQWRLYGYNEKD